MFTFLEQFIVLTPRVGSMLGGTLIQVIGNNIKFTEAATYTCLFDNTKVEAVYILQSGKKQILCVSPPLKRVGRIRFALSYSNPLNNMQKVVLANDTFFSCKYIRNCHLRTYVCMYVCT